MKRLIEQVFKFGIVGVLSTILDYCLMVFLKEIVGFTELWASGISFTVSVVFNYICSMKYVFNGRDDISKKREFIVFVILSIIGLGINQFMIWILPIDYRISKLVATGVVMIWNFVSRKILLEDKTVENDK